MKKKLLFRCIIGGFIGITISTVITIIISIFIGDGVYYPVVPELISDCKNEINAVILQTICSLICGMAWAGASIVWEIESLGMLRQTIIHFLIASIASFPIAYFMRWMQHSVLGIISYFGIWIFIYIIIWLSVFLIMKNRLKKINQKIQEKNDSFEV